MFSRSVLFALLASVALDPASAQETEVGKSESLEVRVYPPSFERDTAALEEFLASGKYDARRHAELSLAVAQDLFTAADYDAAEDLLKRTEERLRKEGAEESPAMAGIYDALASLFKLDGKIPAQVGNLWRARHTLAAAIGEHHPVTHLAALRVHNAYLEAAAAGINRYNLGVALRRLKDLIEESREYLGASHTVTLLAELSLARFDIARDHERDALERLDDIVRRATVAGRDDSVAAAAALLFKARIYRDHAEWERMEEAVEQLSGHLSENSEPVLLFEMDDETMNRYGAESERDYLMQMSGTTIMYPLDLLSLHRDPFEPLTLDPLKPTSDISGSWANVSFCVGKDGHVSDVAVLDAGGQALRSSKEWRQRIEAAIAARRYAQAPHNDGEDCTPRYERVTLTSDSITIVGTRIPRKSSRTYIVRNDLLDGELGGGYLRMTAIADEGDPETP